MISGENTEQNFIYLDNAAAAQVDPDLIKRFVGYSEKYFANPESIHILATQTKNTLYRAINTISKSLVKDTSLNVFWTHSATDAINVLKNWEYLQKDEILISATEHPALAAAFAAKNNRVKIKPDGLLDLNDFSLKLNKNIKAFIVHHVQNETGAVQNLLDIRQVLNKLAPDALFIVDTVQSIGKLPVPWKEAGIDIAFCGGHKIGIPTGGALLYRLKNKSVSDKFNSYLKNFRSIHYQVSRTDIPVALTLADAICKAVELLPERHSNITRLNTIARKKLGKLNNIKFLIKEQQASPYILTFLLPNIQAEVLVRILSTYGFMLSSGSACKAASDTVSESLLAMNLTKDQARSVIRLSFGFFSEEKDIENLFEIFNMALKNY